MNDLTQDDNNELIVEVDEESTTFLSPLLAGENALRAAARRRRSRVETKAVHHADVENEVATGWEIQKVNKTSTRMKRPKAHGVQLEDRSWVLFHAMGYSVLNGDNFNIHFVRDDGSRGKKQVDVYAEDDETVVVVECKSRENRGRRSLQKDIHESAALQKYFRKSIYTRFGDRPKPKIIWVYVTRNIIWSIPDLDRAVAAKIRIVTENELQYFETFIKHMGPAGKYQILGEFLRGQKVPGLANKRLPAIRGSLGGDTFFAFVTTPRHLLKISFVNHQALNHPDGRPAYQRMISSRRIKEIGAFIKNGGYFPTNLLVNFSEEPRFDFLSNKENADPNIKFGWLTLPQKFRSAWIIDGQHRLYGYSHLDESYLDQSLFVIAFARMAVQREADLFITINHKQKSVPKSLLMSLLADIRLGDSDPSTSLSALASAVVRRLNTSITYSLGRRFALPDVPAEPGQNLTISEGVKGLRRSGLIGRVVKNTTYPGPLCGATDEETIARATEVIGAYFDALQAAAPKRWGAGKNAYVATNPAIRAHLIVIAESIQYLTHKKSIDFETLATSSCVQELQEFCKPIFEFLGSASDDEIKDRFSRRFGEGGVRDYTFHLFRILNQQHPDFGSDDFLRWVEQTDSEKIAEVAQFLLRFVERLHNYIVNTLKSIHGTHRLESGEQAFWELGVKDRRVRDNAYTKQQATQEKRKPKEAYLDIIDFIAIAKQEENWPHFKFALSNPRPSEKKGQKYYLGWIDQLNQVRNTAAHRNQLKSFSDEDLDFVEWIRAEVSPRIPGEQ